MLQHILDQKSFEDSLNEERYEENKGIFTFASTDFVHEVYSKRHSARQKGLCKSVVVLEGSL